MEVWLGAQDPDGPGLVQRGAIAYVRPPEATLLMFPRGMTFDDVLLVPGYNGIRSRQAVNTEVALGPYMLKIPVLSANMDTITGPAMAAAMAELGGMGILHRFLSIEDNVASFRSARAHGPVGVSIGVTGDSMERAEALVAAGADVICVDVAHGHSKLVNRMIRALRDRFGDGLCIIAGNVATYAGADYLAAAGADIIKVGIGPGSVCTTRIKTGCGVPQLTAILDCRKVDRPLIADGGIRTPGDAVKALAAGASYVMIGGMLAGTEETPGEVMVRQTPQGEQRVKVFRGMASREAQEDFMGAMADWKTAEGIAIEVPVRGSVAEVVADLMGGIRSGMTYCGATDIKSLQRKAQFMEISNASLLEGMPHALGRITAK
ncbi:MAG: IMP dehydrogenase [Myxococcales bacterium]|nr:IMP dehydrogenase [Myxococcales bacterium]